MNIFLARHATAEPHDAFDPETPLTPQGKAEARMMGRFLRDAGIHIDLIVASDYKRTTQTAKRISNRIDVPIVYCEGLRPDYPDRCHADKIWASVEQAAGFTEQHEGPEHLLLVSHGPTLHDLRDFLCGAPQTTSRFHEKFVYGCIVKLEDGIHHWTVTPKLISKILGEEKKLSESVREVAESLRRSEKVAIVQPLIRKLAAATKTRFRKQGATVAKAIKERLQETHIFHAKDIFDRSKPTSVLLREADIAAANQAAGHALAGFSYPAWLAAHRKATNAAYRGGSGYAAGQLEATEPDDLGGPDRTAELAETQIDTTTRDRVLAAIEDGLEQAAILAAVAGVFKSGVQDRAETIALSEISNAFHDGMVDAAEAISLDTGDDVEKHWDAGDNACEDCMDCDDEGWVDLDFEYPAFGVDEPEGHPNCDCSLEVRRAKE